MVSYNSPNIEDEYVDPDLKTVFTTESASAVASKLFSSTIPLRVLYDINIKRFYVRAADDLIHSDMLYLAIAAEASKLGLKSIRRWTDSDLHLFNQLISEGKSDEEIAVLLGRSLSSIKHKRFFITTSVTPRSK
jgi:hypothetical protein